MIWTWLQTASCNKFPMQEKIFAWSKVNFYTFKTVKNTHVDQTEQMCRLVCTFLVLMQQSRDFPSPDLGPIISPFPTKE